MSVSFCGESSASDFSYNMSFLLKTSLWTVNTVIYKYIYIYIYIYIYVYAQKLSTIVSNYNLISAWRHVSAADTAIFRPA